MKSKEDMPKNDPPASYYDLLPAQSYQVQQYAPTTKDDSFEHAYKPQSEQHSRACWTQVLQERLRKQSRVQQIAIVIGSLLLIVLGIVLAYPVLYVLAGFLAVIGVIMFPFVFIFCFWLPWFLLYLLVSTIMRIFGVPIPQRSKCKTSPRMSDASESMHR